MVSPNWQIFLSLKYEFWWHHLKGLFVSFQKIIKFLTLDPQNSSYGSWKTLMKRRGWGCSWTSFNSHNKKLPAIRYLYITTLEPWVIFSENKQFGKLVSDLTYVHMVPLITWCPILSSSLALLNICLATFIPAVRWENFMYWMYTCVCVCVCVCVWACVKGNTR